MTISLLVLDQQQRTPAMAAGITDYLWTMEQLLKVTVQVVYGATLGRPAGGMVGSKEGAFSPRI